MSNDQINGLFELVGGLLIFMSVRALYVSKEVKGVSIFPVVFFASWGFWNVYYYPSLNQWYSFVGGLVVVSANVVWVCQMVYYRWFYKGVVVEDCPVREGE